MTELQQKADEWMTWFNQNLNRKGQIVDIDKRTEFMLKGLGGVFRLFVLLANTLAAGKYIRE